MVEKPNREQRERKRVNLLGWGESVVVGVAAVGGLVATFVPRPEICIPGAIAAAAASVWVLTRWDRPNKP